MGYVRTTWTDRVVAFPRRYRDELNNQKTFTPDEGTVTAVGTPITAAAMNNIESCLAILGNAYTTANATANAYTVTIPNIASLTDGLTIKVKFNAASSAALTLNINGLGAKAVVDYFGNAVTNVRANLIANLVYDSVNGNFQLQGKGGGGNLTDGAKLLTGYTASGDNGPIVGTMPAIGYGWNPTSCAQWADGGIAVYLPTTGRYIAGAGGSEGRIPVAQLQACVSGLTSSNILSGASILGVAGGIPIQSEPDSIAAGYMYNGYAYLRPAAGYYGGGVTNNVKSSQPDIVASNIISGKSIFGVAGTATIGTLGGKKWASGTVSGLQYNTISISGLGFTPTHVFWHNSSARGSGYGAGGEYNAQTGITYSFYPGNNNGSYDSSDGITRAYGSFSSPSYTNSNGVTWTWYAFGD